MTKTMVPPKSLWFCVTDTGSHWRLKIGSSKGGVWWDCEGAIWDRKEAWDHVLLLRYFLSTYYVPSLARHWCPPMTLIGSCAHWADMLVVRDKTVNKWTGNFGSQHIHKEMKLPNEHFIDRAGAGRWNLCQGSQSPPRRWHLSWDLWLESVSCFKSWRKRVSVERASEKALW